MQIVLFLSIAVGRWLLLDSDIDDQEAEEEEGTLRSDCNMDFPKLCCC